MSQPRYVPLAHPDDLDDGSVERRRPRKDPRTTSRAPREKLDFDLATGRFMIVSGEEQDPRDAGPRSA